MRDLLAWVITIEVLGMAVLPLLRAFFGNRRDAALLSRPLGLAAVAYAAWVLTLGGLPFERGVLGISLVAVGIAAFVVHRRTRSAFPGRFWEKDEKLAATLFWASTGVFLVIRAAWPEILGQEKFMDLAFLNSLTRNANMPPLDPWMAGRTINYYYWGYLLAAAATKLSGIATTIAYNLAIATFGGFSFVAAACLGFRLSRGRLAAGLGAAAATVFAGNVVGAFDGWGFFLGRGFDYFHASRVIASGDTINEFPFFTFLQADLHPHLLGFPYFIAVFAVAHGFLVRESAPPPGQAPGLWGFLRRWSPAVLLAFAAGNAIAANLWTLPAVGILLCAAGALRKVQGKQLPNLREAVRGFFGGALVLFVAYELWWSYEASFSLTTRNPQTHGLARATQVSPLLEFLGVWGILFAVAFAALWPRTSASVEESGRRDGDLRIAAVAAAAVFAAFLAKMPALVVLLPLLILAGSAAWESLRSAHDADLAFAAMLLMLGLAMVIGCEFVYFRDSYGEKLQRMNTIFKFYNQAWPLIATGAAVFAERLWRDSEGRRRRTVASLLAAASFAAILYPAAAIVQRLGQHQGAVTLDAQPALARRNTGDAAAIQWLLRNARPGSVVMEATGAPYSEYARISSHTGLPTVLGWANHEGLWREDTPEVTQRSELVRTFYSAVSPDNALDILRAFKVTYVVLGELETRSYPGAVAVAEYPFLTPASPGATTVFQVRALP